MKRSENLSNLVAKFDAREAAGLRKYGCTVDRADLTPTEWAIHRQEELMDALLYDERMQVAMSLLEEARALLDDPKIDRSGPVSWCRLLDHWVARYDQHFEAGEKSPHWFDRERNMPAGCPCDRHDGDEPTGSWIDKVQTVAGSEASYPEDHPVFICAEHLVVNCGAGMPLSLRAEIKAFGHAISWVDAYNLIRRVRAREKARMADFAAG